MDEPRPRRGSAPTAAQMIGTTAPNPAVAAAAAPVQEKTASGRPKRLRKTKDMPVEKKSQRNFLGI